MLPSIVWGGMFDQGVDGAEDDLQALAWYKKSAEQGVAPAMLNLGWLYVSGGKIEKDYQKAVLLFKQAANKGLTLGWASLGYMYENGFGVQKDDRKALQFYQKDYSDKAKKFYRDLARKMPCEQTAVVELLDMPLMCADKKQIHDALDKMNMSRVEVNGRKTMEIYVPRNAMPGLKRLKVLYSSGDEMANVTSAECELAATQTAAAHEKQFHDNYNSFVEKYGRPEGYREGDSVGYMWETHEGVSLHIVRRDGDDRGIVLKYFTP